MPSIQPDQPHNDPAGPSPKDGHLEDRQAERLPTRRGLGFSLSARFVSDELPDVKVDVPGAPTPPKDA